MPCSQGPDERRVLVAAPMSHLDVAVKAHGGLEAWNRLESVWVDFSIGGALWDLKGQAGVCAIGTYEAALQGRGQPLATLATQIVWSAFRPTDCLWRRQRNESHRP